jgi:ornithine cyclodeaminase
MIIKLDAIKAALADIDLLPKIEAGYRAYSEGRCIIPPVGELMMEKGEVHIKYGCIRGESHYVIKIASGFYGNSALGLPSGNGMMLLFSQDTGEPVAVYCDEAHLTDVRTAVGGAVGAKWLAPKEVSRIGIVGTGLQARLQLKHLLPLTTCRSVLVHGRDAAKLEACREDMGEFGFDVATTLDPAEIGASCNLIVTTTAATEPILRAEHIRPGTHITAIGSDTPHKQELDGAILAAADVVVADSIEQCLLRGEIFKAIEAGLLAREDLVEIGDIIAGGAVGRSSDEQITVFDSTGVAVQDIAIVEAVHEALGSSPGRK